MDFKKRENFLNNYLQLFGVSRLEINLVALDKICGQAFFSDNESQDICWYMTEEKVPHDKVLDLIRLLNDDNLVTIDKLQISPESLFAKTRQADFHEFIKNYEEFVSIPKNPTS